MTEALATPQAPLPEAVEAALVEGDVSKLNAGQRMVLYKHMCESQGLNMFTRPFQLMKGQDGKLWYYAGKNAADQLRKVHHITIHVPSAVVEAGCYVVTAVASDPQGRSDIDIGVVSIEGLKGDARSNALMKAHTKAKRRVTLSICGLSMLDESELESMPGAVIYEDRPRDPQDFPSPAVQKALDRTHAKHEEVRQTINRVDDILFEAKDAEVQAEQAMRESIKGGAPPLEASGPFVDSASPAPVSPAAPASAPGAAENTTERKPRPPAKPKTDRPPEKMNHEEAYVSCQEELTRLCGNARNATTQQHRADYLQSANGGIAISEVAMYQLPKTALIAILVKLRAMENEQPPAVPPGGGGAVTGSRSQTASGQSSVSAEEDTPDFPPPQTDGSPQGATAGTTGNGHDTGPTPAGKASSADPQQISEPSEDPIIIDGYASKVSVGHLRGWCIWMKQVHCFEELTEKCPRDEQGHVYITPGLWQRIIMAVKYRAAHPDEVPA